MNSADRRQHARVPYGAWVEDETHEAGLRFFLAENLSVGGLMLKANGEIPAVGHRVRLRLVIENESRVMSVQGEVVRHAGDGGFAVAFTNLDPVRKAFLADLVGELGHGEGGVEI
ncbi:MAG: PilZ domain-containing protein [Myxococcales bacterium]|nr:PilZ domain-containing protein [Myxococcales bacterium]